MSWTERDRRAFADGDVLKAKSVPGRRKPAPTVDEWDDVDWGDDEPIVASCDLENPESCESCQ